MGAATFFDRLLCYCVEPTLILQSKELGKPDKCTECGRVARRQYRECMSCGTGYINCYSHYQKGELGGPPLCWDCIQDFNPMYRHTDNPCVAPHYSVIDKPLVVDLTIGDELFDDVL